MASESRSRSRAEIIAVGHELLVGRTADTNSRWLALRLTASGWTVARITVVDDRHDDIAEALGAAVAAGSGLVVLTGGLGPTGDDLTLAAVAGAAGVPLREDAQALAWVEAFYARLAREGTVGRADLTPARRKMARLPAGAEPLANPDGAAPGVLLSVGATLVCCLPGVPSEMTGIFEGSLAARIAGAGPGAASSLVVDTGLGDESELSPLLDRLRHEFPSLWVKSLAGCFAAGGRIPVVLGSGADAPPDARARAEARLKALLQARTSEPKG